MRKVPKNPLAGPLNLLSRKGPQPTERTNQILRRYDLLKLQQDDPEATLAQLQREIAAEPTADKIHAFSELAYIAAYKADAMGDDAKALNLYGAATFYAYDFLFDPSYDAFRNPYDPQFRRACDVYNSALEAALRLIRHNGQLLPGESLMVDTGSEEIRVDVVARGSWRADEFERLEFASDYEITGLKNQHHSYGLGVPMLAIRRPGDPSNPVEKYYPKTLSFPVTAFLRIVPAQPDARGGGVRRCVLELFDPIDSLNTVVANRLVPLETDISTALGYKLEQGRENNESLIATVGLLNPDEAEEIQGLYMVEPFDPNKIPVLMVHGLWSSPMTWMEMFNDLLAYPDIRSNYQFWFYLYPTGEPFWYSANRLRNDLAELRNSLDPYRRNPVFDQLVLVGHSMGGLVSVMQTLDSNDDFWHILSDRPFGELKAEPELRDRVARTVFFDPNPMVRRVITIGTPHRGSRFANDYTRFLARKLIHLPSNVLWVTQQLTLENPGFFRDTEMLTISTSIDSLAPDSPVLPVMLHASRAPWTRYHNIVGVVEQDWLLKYFSNPGDGVVSYESAHREDFTSEVVVDADHVSVHAHPRSILEVRRILLQHLNEASSVPRRGIVPVAGNNLPGEHRYLLNPHGTAAPRVR
jgi:pimeloyl-ACP methyl ester carboxylesterase